MRAAAVLLGLFLTVPAFSQQVPDPISRSELGTVKSVGANSPNADANTVFYTYGNAGQLDPKDYSPQPQFMIASHPGSNEYAMEQSGLGAPGGVGVGQGATRICTAPYSNNQVNCNYVAYGRLGQHRFGNGSGFQFETINQGLGSATGWLQALSSDDETARLWAAGATDVALEFKGKGNGDIFFKSDVAGTLATMENAASGATDSYMRLVSALSPAANPRVQAGSATAADVSIDLRAKGVGSVVVLNDLGTVAKFNGVSGGGASVGYVEFSAALSGGPAIIDSNAAGAGVVVANNRINVQNAVSTVAVPTNQSGAHYHNLGAGATTTYNLPAASQGLNYCFTARVAPTLIVKAAGSDRIAVAGTNSVAGGQISASAPFASICIEAHHGTGQWITISTPDKAQWTVT